MTILVVLLIVGLYVFFSSEKKEGVVLTGSAQKNNQIDVNLEVEEAKKQDDSYTYRIKLTIKNSGSTTFHLDPILKGPGLGNDFFEVKGPGGGEVMYQGKMKKRMAPDESEFVKIGSGESYETVFDLTDSYPLASSGVYQIRISTPNHFSKNPMHIESPWVSFEI